MFRDQEVIHSDVKLSKVIHSDVQLSTEVGNVVATYVDGEPCIVIAGNKKGAGVYLQHVVTLEVSRYLPCKELVTCVCINATGTKAFFGIVSGWMRN